MPSMGSFRGAPRSAPVPALVHYSPAVRPSVTAVAVNVAVRVRVPRWLQSAPLPVHGLTTRA